MAIPVRKCFKWMRWALRPPERRMELEDQVKKVKEQKGLLFETIHQRKDGMIFPVEVSTRMLEVEGETFHQSIIRDITERKRAEEEIRRTRAFLDSIIENIPDMILIKDAKDLRVLHVNKAAEKLTGFSREERIGKTSYDIFPKEEADFFTAKDRETSARKTITMSRNTASILSITGCGSCTQRGFQF